MVVGEVAEESRGSGKVTGEGIRKYQEVSGSVRKGEILRRILL